MDLAGLVCAELKREGFSYCPGGIQALANSALPLSIPKKIIGLPATTPIDGERKINIKEYLTLFEIAARLYSLKYGIKESGTLERLGIAKDKKIIHPASYNEFKNSFDQLWDLRFHRQMNSYTRLSKIDDTILVSELSRDEKKMLQSTRDHLKTLTALLNHDFLGQAI